MCIHIIMYNVYICLHTMFRHIGIQCLYTVCMQFLYKMSIYKVYMQCLSKYI